MFDIIPVILTMKISHIQSIITCDQFQYFKYELSESRTIE